jgi:hypothetical protein
MREEMRSQTELAALADRQHGLVSHAQLVALGVSKSTVGRMSRSGRLHRVHRGVYAVGRRGISRHGTCLAAVLACGRDAVLSHGSAGWLWGLLAQNPAPAEVTVPGRGHPRAGIHVRRSRRLHAEDCTTKDDIPVTALPRTLLDLAATGSQKRTEGVLERAERLGILELVEIDAMLAGSKGARGAPSLRRALDLYRHPAFTRSLLERRFVALVRKSGLPMPAMNMFVAGIEVDAYWERERFAVELDGFDAHRTREAFERDPLRQEQLKLAGIDSIRLTARRVEREPARVASRLSTLLDRRRPPSAEPKST